MKNQTNKADYQGKSKRNSRKRNSNGNRRSSSGSMGKRNFQDKFAAQELRKGRDEERAEQEKQFGNDPAWYNRFPEISVPANSVTYSWPIGQYIDFDPSYTTLDTAFVMPGILTLRLAPSFGYSDSGTSPLNIATQDLYSTVRKSQTGATNYDPQDMMIYTVAMSSVYSYIVFLQRIYGSMFISTLENRYTPKALLTAQGVNYESMLNNLADFRSGLNQLIVAASAFNVPASIEYFRRMSFLYRDIYIEGTTPKQAMYMYVPSSFFIYSEGTSQSAAGMLSHKMYNPPAGGYSYDALLNYGYQMLAPLKGSQDSGVISGDLGKAFEGNLVMLQFVSEQFTMQLQYSEEVLQQFRNATIFDTVVNNANTPLLDTSALFSPVTQHVEVNNTYLVHTPTLAVDFSSSSQAQQLVTAKYFSPFRAYFEGKKILNTMPAYANPAGTSVATRLMATTSPFIFEDGGTVGEARIYSGTEIVTGARVFILADDMTTVNAVPFGPVVHTFSGSTGSGVFWPRDNASSLTAEIGRSAFHYAPFSYKYITNGSDVTTFIGVMGDFDTYTVVDTDTIRQMHRSAIYSLMMP